MEESLKAQLERIERSTSRIERAVFGEVETGLRGLVHDMETMQDLREKQMLRAAGVAGAVSALILGGKAFLAKYF